MAVPLLVLGVVAAGQMISGLKQADDIRSANELNRMLDEMNAEWLEQDAWEAEKYGYTASTRYQTMVDGVVGDQRIAYAAGGVDVGFGTAAAIQEEAKLTGFLNQLDIQNQAHANAKNIKQKAMNLRFGAKVRSGEAESAANAATNAGYLNAGKTIASGYSGSFSASSKSGIPDLSRGSPYITATKEKGDSILAEYDRRNIV